MKHTNRRRRGWKRAAWLIALGAAGAWQGPATAEDDGTIYRWVDRQGQVHFSDHPPDDLPAQAIQPAPPAPTGDDSAQRIKEFVDRSEAEAAAKQAEEQARRKAEEAAAARQQACEQARRSRARMGDRPRVLLINPDGSARRLTEEERQARLAELERMIADCGPPK